jgi:CHAD domain-containing protein
MAVLARVRRPPALVLSPDDGVGAAARAIVRLQLRGFADQEAGARAGDVEAVHQLRVATRRLRAALRLLAPVLPPTFVRSVRPELSWLAGAIGAVRDLDVLTETVTARAPELDTESRRALGPLALALHDQRAARHTALMVALDSTRCRALLERLATFGESPPPTRQPHLGALAPDLIRPLLRSVIRTGRRASTGSPPATLHRLRVRAKRLRYALETLRGLGGRSAHKLVRRLVRLQELLGQCQDMATGIVWLRAYAAGSVPPATALATGGLIQALTRRERKLRRRFPEAWARLDRGRLRSAMAAELAASARRRARPAPRPLRATGS